MRNQLVNYFIVLSLVLFSSISGIAQTRYAIYKFTEGAKYQTKNKEWLDLSRKQPLSLIDLLLIPDKGNVTIVDTKTNSLYRSTQSGPIRVKKLIDDAIKESSDITGRLNETIVEKLKESEDQKRSYAVLGAVYRGNNQNAHSDIYLSICHMLEKIESNEYQQLLNDSCTFSRSNQNDEEFYFTIHNSSSKLYFVNLLCISESGHSFCFRSQAGTQPSPIIGPHETIDFPQYLFANTSDSSNYLLVASENPFNVSDIEMMLNNHVKLEGTPSPTTIVVPEQPTP